MKDLEEIKSFICSQNEYNYFNKKNSSSHGFENVSIIIVNKKTFKNRKKHNVFMQAQQPRIASRLSRSSKHKKYSSITRHSSMPELTKYSRPVTAGALRNRNETKLNKYKKRPFQSQFIVNVVSEHRFDTKINPFNYPRQTKLKIYRCQLGAAQDSCCCSCNSDAMFEVMKGLYDCYKARNCDNCDCILCGHLKPEQRKKSITALSEKERLKRAKDEGLLTPLTGKTPEQREKILRGLSMKGLPLPEGKTPSEIELIHKVRTELGLPKEPRDKTERDKHEQAAKAGKLWPLEGNTSAEKEKILKDLQKMGIALPEGRTPSEKSLIAKLEAKSRASKASAKTLAPSEQMRRAKAEGLLTPLAGKTPEQKMNILKGLAMKGIPLPEGKTPSEKKLINKVRADLALPKEPINKAERNKHEKAAKAGKLWPLEGRTPEQKEKILKNLHNMGIQLPEGRTPSEKSLIAKIAAGSRHPSKVSKVSLSPSEQMRRAKAEGLLTPLTGKKPEQKEKILKGLAMKGIPLPEGKTPSEKKLINKVRADLALPKEPINKAERNKHEKAAKAGKLWPLEGRTPEQKEKILKNLHNMGIQLPEGRTPSEKSLIAKIAAGSRHPSKVSKVSLSPSEQMRRAKAEGLLTPLTGKTPEQKEKILKELAMKGIPLPEGKTPSEKKLINKVRADLALPKEPINKAERNKHEKAAKAGKLWPLEGRTPEQKEKILKNLHNMGIQLPEGRTPSEKSLIAKITAGSRHPSKVSEVSLSPSEQMRRAKAEGLLTPLTGKTPEQKEKILKGLSMKGLPLPEGKTPSEKKLIEKVRTDLGLPKEPKSKSERDKQERAARAGLLQPLEGKTPAQKEKILKGLHDLGIALPEGRTPSEKALIAKVAAQSRHPSKVSAVTMAPSEQMRRAKAEGLLTPLKGKTPEQKEKILNGLAMKGIPLPEGETPSEKKLIDKVRADLGLPKEPKNKAERAKHDQAAKAGLLQPLEGKTPAQKERILKGLHDMGISLPVGRTPSEKSLIAKVAASSRRPSKVSLVRLTPSEQMRKAKAEGLLTPLTGKTPEQKEKILEGLAKIGLPLPEGKTPSDKKLINKVRADLGLPKEPKTKTERDKYNKAAKAGFLQPLEGKTPAQKENILKGLHDLGIALPEGRTPSEKSLIAKVAASSRHPSKVSGVTIAPSEQMRRAIAAGLLTPLTGKTPEQKEKILEGLAMKGLPLPEGKTDSEKKLINKVRADLGLPKEPKNKAERDKQNKAAKAGLLQPLEGKTPAQKEKILKGLHDLGIALPEGRTPSEKALIAKVAAKSRHPSRVSAVTMAASDQMRRAIAEGLLTPLTGKTPEAKQKILEGLAKKGLALPEGKTASEKQLIDKIRADLGLPKEPKNKSERAKHNQAAKAGFLQPLEGKTPDEKEKILKGLHDLGIALPEGRTASEKALIAKVAAKSRHPSRVSAVTMAPSEQLRRARKEGLLTPLTGKTPEEKQKILEGLAKKGLALPEGKTASEKKLIDKVRADLGLPKEPKNKAERAKHDQAARAGLLQPLEGKTPAQKENILQGLHDLGIPLPEGRTPSEKALIAKVAAKSRHPSRVSAVTMAPSEQLRRAKAEGLLTPLTGKTPEAKQKILEGLAKKGLALPEGKTDSEKKLIDKIRADLGLPKEPKNKAERTKHDQAARAGLLQPLEGKTPAQKENILKGLHDLGIALPEGRTPSEKALIAKVAAKSRHPSRVSAVTMAPSEQLRRAKAEGLLTPLTGKTPEQKEKVLAGLAKKGLPLPEGKTASEKQLINKVRADLGLPKEPKNKAERAKHNQAARAGLLQPLEGKTPAQKERILKGLHDLGIPLPEGRTASEKSLIAKVAAKSRHPSRVSAVTMAPSEQMRRAKAEGLLTPLTGKTPEQKEKILAGLAKKGLPLPEGKTDSEKKLIDKVRLDLGLPKEPKNKAETAKHNQAARAGLLQPLEGKTPAQKKKILEGLHDLGIALPEGRTPSEKALIANVAAKSRHPSRVSAVTMAPSEQLRRAKAEGLLTPLTGKTPEQKEKILTGLAKKGLPLPEGKTASQKKLIDKVRADLGLPKEPKSKAERAKHNQAARAGLLQPLEGKTPAQKERILKGLHDLGIPLPEGRTASEKSLIAKVAAKSRHPSRVSAVTMAPSEQMRRAKAEGLLTPLKGKSPEQQEKILKALANRGLPLPEGQTPSEKNVIEKVRADLGLPKEPKTKADRDKLEKAALAGLLLPLEGKTPAQKEKILRGQHNMGIPLPEGRTPSEKSLIAKIAASSRHPSRVPSVAAAPSEQMRRAKAEGLLSPLMGKSPEQKQNILKALAYRGLPLPEGQSPSEKNLIDKVRAELGLPKEPKTDAERAKHEKAAKAGYLLPLEGKTPAQKEKILKGLHDMGIPLPEGRTPSEKSLIAKVAASSRRPSMVSTIIMAPSEQLRRAKEEGLLTPLTGKTPEQKEKILAGLAKKGLPLPEGKTASEKQLINKVRADLGLPKEPKNKAERGKHNQAARAGLLQPLEDKTPAQKEKILQGLHDLGIPLPEGRTASEKALIAKVAAKSRHPSRVHAVTMAASEQLRRAKAEGLLTPLTGKTPEQKEKILAGLAKKGLALPEGKTDSEKKLIGKVRADLGLPKEPKNKAERAKHDQAARAGLLQPLEGKTPAQKENILQGLHDLGIALPEGRTPSEKALIAKVAAKSRHPSRVSAVTMAPSEQMRRAKAEGLLTPLTGKTPEQKEKILAGLGKKGLALPEGKTDSEKKLIDKVRADLGLPKEPKNKAERAKHYQAARAGLLQPLEGKTPAQKEKILQGLHDLGIPLPEGRTASEKSLIAKVAAKSRHPSRVSAVTMAPSEQMRRAKAEGLLTPLTGKTPEQKEKILAGLAKKGLALPEGKTDSEKKLIDKVRADLGLPKEPKNKAERAKHNQAARAGLLQPLEGKTPAQKERILKGLHDLGIPLPEGRTASEKALIAKVAAKSRHPSRVSAVTMAPSEQVRRAKAEGLLTPLTGKTPEQKEKILAGLAKKGLALPEGKTDSEKKLIDKVRADLGLPKEPKNKAERAKHNQAARAGLLQPLEGKTPAQKERILKGLHDLGIPLPEGRTASEKALIAKVAAKSRHPSRVSAVTMAPSEQVRRAKAEGLLTPLSGKTPEQKEKILTGLAKKGLALPEGKTDSEKKLIDKVRADLGLPKEPKNKAERAKHDQAARAGLLQPLEGKTPAQKEKILEGLHDLGIALPEGRTASEKALIAKVAAKSRHPSRVSAVTMAPSEQLRRAKAEGLLTPLTGKTPDQKQKILERLAMRGLPLPEGKTPSEKKLIDKVRADLGLPKEPKNEAERDKHDLAAKDGLLQPLEGKTPAQKEKILKGLHDLGITLPEGRTPSEKALIAKVAASSRRPSKITKLSLAPSEQMRRAKAEGLLTPLTGKTPEQKEKILKGLAMAGLPLPEGQTPSEKKLVDKVRFELGLPKEPKTKAERNKHEQAAKAGLLKPLEGKTPAQKKKILKGLHNLGISLPEGRTPSEKALIAKIAATSRPPSIPPEETPSEKLRKAKLEGPEGLLTPLTGKTPEQKEKIVRGLAMAGLPLPDGQTPSEIKLIDKVRADVGLPPAPKTKAEKEKHEKAAKAGLLKPLADKTPEEKEAILKGLHDLGITLPEGRTASEKALIAKITAAPALAASVTKKKTVAAGIQEELQEIVKTTTCDRACGCTKKKIRFKHSYVKIRVTSPDISSFCDCPGECFPGVKSGAFIDNDGIKVTVGRVIGIPSFTISQTNNRNAQYRHKILSVLQNNYSLTDSSSVESCNSRPCSTESENIYLQGSTYESITSKSDRIVECLRRLQSFDDIYTDVTSETKYFASSLDSVLVIKSEISLCSSNTTSVDAISSMSIMKSSISSNCTRYSDNQFTDDPLSSSLLDGPVTSNSDDSIGHPGTVCGRGTLRNIETVIPQREYTVSRMSPTKYNFGNNSIRINKSNSKTVEEPIVLFNHLPSKLDVSKIIYKIMANKRFAGASSIFIVVPESDDDEEQSFSDSLDSMTSIYASETSMTQQDSSEDPNATSGSFNPVVRPLSLVSAIQGPSVFLSKTGGCCRLPDMRTSTPSPESLDLLSKVPTRPSIGPSQLPHKTFGYYRFPDMTSLSTVSSGMHGRSGSCGVDRNSLIQGLLRSTVNSSEMHDCSHISVILATSSKSLDHLCRMPNCCDGQVHVPQLEPGQQPDRRRHTMNNLEPDSPSTYHHQCKQACTRCGLKTDFLKKGSIVPRKSLCESLSHQKPNKARPRSNSNKGSTKNTTTFKTNPPRPTDRPVDVSDSITHENLRGSKSQPSLRASSRSLPSSRLSKNLKRTSNEKNCVCDEDTDTITDEICNRKSRLQTRWKSIMAKGSTSEEHNNVYEDPESVGIVRDNISGRQTRLQTNWKSKMAISYFSKEKEIEVSNRQPRPQATRHSSLPNGYSTIKHHCVCENSADTTLDKILIQQPCFPESWQTKMPKDSSSEESCLCEDIEDAGIISGEISGQQSKIPEDILSEMDIKGAAIVTDEMLDRQQYHQANRQLKISKDSANKEDREIPGPGLIIEETKNQLSRSRASQLFLQEKPKLISFKKKCKCQENEGDFGGQVDCECQKKSKDSGNKEFCVCQDLEESYRRCFNTNPVSKNSNKITKFLSSIRKSISHKTDETSKMKGGKVKCKCLETSNIKEEKVKCKCLEETSKIKEEKVKCKCLEKTSNIKGEKVKCKCIEETSNIKGEKAKCKCLEETSKIKAEKVKCKCLEETSNIKGEKVKCKCLEENPSKSKSQHSIQTTPEVSCEPNCGWMNIGKLIRLTSELAECTSGFKACKKKKKLQIEGSVQEIELDFEAAVKYYVGKNPEQFWDLLEPLELNQDKYQSRKGEPKLKKKKEKKAKKKSYKRDKKNGSVNLKDSQKNVKTPPKEPCECPYGPTPLYEACKLTPEKCAELANLYPKGFKFCLGGRGLAPVTKRAAGMADRDVVARTQPTTLPKH